MSSSSSLPAFVRLYQNDRFAVAHIIHLILSFFFLFFPLVLSLTLWAQEAGVKSCGEDERIIEREEGND